MTSRCDLLGAASCLLALMSASCGRVEFDAVSDGGGDAPSACAAMGAVLCDDFARTTPLVAGVPWSSDTCPGAGDSLAVDGALEIAYPAYGGTFDQCQLVAAGLVTARSLQLDFDFTFQPHVGDQDVVVAAPAVSFATANAAGVQSI